MNRETRQAVAKSLIAFRKQLGVSRAELATRLGWTVQTYSAAEAGTHGLSEGEQNDVRRVMREAITGAAIRDKLRGSPRRLVRP